MVIDGDDRGVFDPGTRVTANGGPAVEFEAVDPGRHTLRIDVHWERIPFGNDDRSFGTFSVSTTAKEC